MPTKTKVYKQLGHEFVEIDLDDHPNVTITRGGTPLVLARDHSDQTNVNIVTLGRKLVKAMLNNRVVDDR